MVHLIESGLNMDTSYKIRHPQRPKAILIAGAHLRPGNRLLGRVIG